MRSGMAPVMLRNPRFLQIIVHSDDERIANTDYADRDRELERVRSLDGSNLAPNLRYLYRFAKAPRIANQVTVARSRSLRPWLTRALTRRR